MAQYQYNLNQQNIELILSNVKNNAKLQIDLNPQYQR
jgi:hypothetical protein